MSQYFYKKHNTTWKVLCTLFMHLCLCIRDLTCSLGALLFDYLYVNSSCGNTIHIHFPWSIIYNLIQLYLILYLTCQYYG